MLLRREWFFFGKATQGKTQLLELSDEGSILFGSEVVHKTLGDDCPDVGDGSELFVGRCAKLLYIGIALDQRLGHSFSYEADAEPKEEGTEGTCFRGFYALEEACCTALLESG